MTTPTCKFLEARLPDTHLVIVDRRHFIWEKAPAEDESELLPRSGAAADDDAHVNCQRCRRVELEGPVPPDADLNGTSERSES